MFNKLIRFWRIRGNSFSQKKWLLAEAAEKNRKKGFTLAEALITLTIVGTVASVTIPSVVNYHRNQIFVMGVKKTHSHIRQAMQTIPIREKCSAGDFSCSGLFEVERGLDVSNVDGQDFGGNPGRKLIYLLSKQFKKPRVCLSQGAECSRLLGNLPYGELGLGELAYVSADEIIYFSADGTTIYSDVNGISGPNKFGVDIFAFLLAPETRAGVEEGTVMPRGSLIAKEYYEDEFYWKDDNKCATLVGTEEDLYCTAKILDTGEINY